MAHLEGSLDRGPTLVCEFLFAIEVKRFVTLTTTNWKVMSVLIPMKELKRPGTAKKGFEVTRIDRVTFVSARAGNTNGVREHHDDANKSSGVCEEHHGAGGKKSVGQRLERLALGRGMNASTTNLGLYVT
jgi:hypothetical protein